MSKTMTQSPAALHLAYVWRVDRLAFDHETYGADSGRPLIVTENGEQEISGPLPEGEPTKITKAHNEAVRELAGEVARRVRLFDVLQRFVVYRGGVEARISLDPDGVLEAALIEHAGDARGALAALLTEPSR